MKQHRVWPGRAALGGSETFLLRQTIATPEFHSGQSDCAPEGEASAPVLKVEPETAPVSLTVKPTKPAKVEQTGFDLSNAGEYELPGIELLTEAAEGVAGPPSQALQQNARMLEAVLADFGVKGEISTIRHGPVVYFMNWSLRQAPNLPASLDLWTISPAP